MNEQPPPPAPAVAAPPNALIPAGWCGLSLVVTCLGVAIIAMLGMESERAGNNAAMLGSIPIGFLLGGAVAAVVMHFAVKNASQQARLGVPFGCGCLGSIGLFGLVFLFFAVIFPML